MFRIFHSLFSDHGSFASGGLLFMLFGSVGVALRSLPEQLWEWLVERVTLTLTVTDADASFAWVKQWLLEQSFSKRLRHVDLDSTFRGTARDLNPAPGRHWFVRNGRLFWVWFSRNESASNTYKRRLETLTFGVLGGNRALLQAFVDEIVACHERKHLRTSYLYVFDGGCWECVQGYAPRVLDSVILKPGEIQQLVADITRFRQSHDRYARLGVPYHRGYLLYGPPGTGKTSLVSALASHFHLSIYLINLTELNDRTLQQAMNQVPENSVVLFEDIDAMKAGEKRETNKKESAKPAGSCVSLSGLLNVLDGLHAPSHVLVFMTTNHIETLDPALLRPGRIDYRLLLGEASVEQRIELYLRFFPAADLDAAERFAQEHSSATMAELQGALLMLMESACDASPENADFQVQTEEEALTA